ncbi:MAG: hypothetical protein HXX18_14170 [Bacteroidetes bacterium]|nr:hypothetical protein [Bacteroidota bacterium]
MSWLNSFDYNLIIYFPKYSFKSLDKVSELSESLNGMSNRLSEIPESLNHTPDSLSGVPESLNQIPDIHSGSSETLNEASGSKAGKINNQKFFSKLKIKYN